MPRKPETSEQLLKRAIAKGATFADFLGIYVEDRKDAPDCEDEIIAKARETKHCEGELEIDDTTMCSGSDGPGDYVLAWVWVDYDKGGES